jgi:hypothetical protein
MGERLFVRFIESDDSHMDAAYIGHLFGIPKEEIDVFLLCEALYKRISMMPSSQKRNAGQYLYDFRHEIPNVQALHSFMLFGLGNISDEIHTLRHGANHITLDSDPPQLWAACLGQLRRWLASHNLDSFDLEEIEAFVIG